MSDMQPRSSLDRGLWIPIAIGVISILGLAWVFLNSDLSEALAPPTMVATPMPLDPDLLEAEGLTSFPQATSTPDETSLTPTGTSSISYPEPPAGTPSLTGVPATESRPIPSALPTAEQGQPLPAGKYDDMDPNITYDRYWTVIKTLGTKNAYKGAIHASAGIGGEASFLFTGEQVYIGYQRAKNLGTVTVIIDDQAYSFHEQAFDLFWRSPQLSPGTHFVRIVHESGESINLDYIVVLD
jgi:hypothetical protein